MPIRKLVLFDIDGTLLTTSGRGRNAFRRAIEESFGRSFDASAISFSGKTDQQILGEILATMGIPHSHEDQTANRILELYEQIMFDQLEVAEIEILKGVRELLMELSALPWVQLGLLTGNLESTAYLKLRLARLDQHFPFGAFGSDHSDRFALPAIAVDRAFQYSGDTFRQRDVVIVGDTDRDVLCAKSASAFSVAVCTGTWSRSELERLEPDVVLDDLSRPQAFLDAIRSEIL